MVPDILMILDDIAPEFAEVDAGRKARFVAYAENQLSERKLKRQYKLASAYLAAHMLTMSERNGRSGAESSIKEGQLSVGYSATGDWRTNWQATGYGEELNGLIKRTILAVRTSNA